MPDYAGTLQRLAVSRTLWLMVAWPLAGLLWQVLVVRPRIARSRAANDVLRQLASARLAGIGCIALAATATLGHALLVARLPVGGRALLQSIGRGSRFSEVDAGVDLLLDTRALMACGLACVVVLSAALVLAMRPPPERGWRPWAWLQLALAAALLCFLADSFVGVAMGWTLAAVASAWLAGWHDARAGISTAMRGAAVLSAVVLGAALLFWGIGGSWDDEGYAAEPYPPIVAANVGAREGDATLSMTSLPGSTVFVDDARTALVRAPFLRVALPAGTHTLRVHPADGTDDVQIPTFEAHPGEDLALVPLAPTLSFHTLADELSIHEATRPRSVSSAVQDHVGPGGVAVVAGALLALLGAAGAMSTSWPPLAAPRVLSAVAAGATTAIGPFLLVRLALLFPLAQHTGVVVASVGAAVLLGAVWSALGYVGLRRWLVFSAGAPAGFAYVALGLGGVALAMGVIVAAGGLAALVQLAAARDGEDEEAIDAATRGVEVEGWLVRVPERLGGLLASMERWVVGSTASAIGGVSRAVAFVVAMADDHLVATPGDVAAAGVERAARRVVPWIGVPLSIVAWGVLAVGTIAALLHAVWPGG